MVVMFLLVKMIGLRASSALGGGILKRVGPHIRAHKYGQRNLKLAFPEKSEKEREEILRKVWSNFGRSFGEFLHSKKIIKNYEKHITIENDRAMTAFLNEKKGGFFATGHFSGWDAMLGAVYKHRFVLHILYRKANNPFANWMFQKIRETDRLKYIEKSKMSAVTVVNVLREKGYVASLLDQYYRKGLDVTFFGHPAKSIPTTPRLAMKLDVPILIASIHREKGIKFKLSLEDHFYAKEKGKTEEEVMQYINDRLEEKIRKHPEDWFWIHRRWGKETEV